MNDTIPPRINGSPLASPPGATVAVDRLAELVEATDGDRRARRRLLDRAGKALAADAQAERRARTALAEAEQRARAVEVQAEARIRAAEARLRIQDREREAARAERAAETDAARDRDQQRIEAAERRRARWAGRRETASSLAPATLSMLVYLAAVASAVFGQVSVATGRYGWSVWRALVLAGFIELMALAMALTANRLRLRGERALAPRTLTWVFAGFAAVVNVWGHLTDPLMAIGLGAASLGGITLWEIRSSARHRDALRAVGQLAEVLPPLGLRFWLLAPGVAMTAYRIGVRTRVSTAAAPLVAQAEAERTVRQATAGTRRGRTALWTTVAFTAGVLGAANLGSHTDVDTQVPASWWIAAGCVVAVLALATRGGRRMPASTPEMTADITADTTPEVLDPWQHSAEITVGQRPDSTGTMPDSPPAVEVANAGHDAGHDAGQLAAQTPVTAPVQAPETGPADDRRDAGHDAGHNDAVASTETPDRASASRRARTWQPTGASTGRGSESARAIGRCLRRSPDASVAEIVQRTRLSERTVRRHLDQLRRETQRQMPAEARQWIGECLRADRCPTGPEVARRYQITPDTARAWIRAVRDGR